MTISTGYWPIFRRGFGRLSSNLILKITTSVKMMKPPPNRIEMMPFNCSIPNHYPTLPRQSRS